MSRKYHVKATPGGVVQSKAVNVDSIATASDLKRLRKPVDKVAIEKALPTEVEQDLYRIFTQAEEK